MNWWNLGQLQNQLLKPCVNKMVWYQEQLYSEWELLFTSPTVLIIADALFSQNIKAQECGITKISLLTTLAICALILLLSQAILRNCSWTLILLLLHMHFKLSFIIPSQCLTASACLKNLLRFWGINSAFFLHPASCSCSSWLWWELSCWNSCTGSSAITKTEQTVTSKGSAFPWEEFRLKKNFRKTQMTENIWNIPQERRNSKAEDLCCLVPVFVCGIIINVFHQWEELKNGMNS